MTKIRSFIQNNKIFFVIITIAAVAHICLFFTLKNIAARNPTAPHATFPISGGGFDAIQYPTLGENILHYGNFSMQPGPNGNPETFRSPGYPLFVAIILYFTGTLNAVPIFQVVLLLLSALVVYLLVLEISPKYKTIGLIVVGLFVFDPTVFYSTQFVIAEMLYAFLFLLCMYFFIQKKYSDKISYIAAGISYGFSAYVRPSGFYMIIPIIVWFIWRLIKAEDLIKTLKNYVIFFSVVFLIIAPWYIRNGIRTGTYAFSSLDAYNSINFNLPVYLTYKSSYKKSIEDIRTELHNKIGNISDDEQMELKNSGMIKKVVWETIKPDLVSYGIFHIGKTANFFFSPSLKLSINIFRGFWPSPKTDSWRPEISVVNSILDGRIKDVFKVFMQNIFYIPEFIFLCLMFVCGLYWYFKEVWRSDAAKLIFLMIFFLAFLTSPISNPRYRVPVVPLIYLSGLAGFTLVLKNLKNFKKSIPSKEQ